MAEYTLDERTTALLAEAEERNLGLQQLADEGVALFGRANPFVRMLLGNMVRNGLGMSLEQLAQRVREFQALLGRLRRGEVAVESAKPQIEHYAVLARRAIRFVEGLESMSTRIKDPAQRQRVVAMARERVESTRRLADVLDELGGEA